jgi:RNA polymerase sigma-70 factor (ECF subfamily)
MSDDRARDEDLMLRVASGNREALAPLVRRYASPLLTFIRRMSGDRHRTDRQRAEELFQETFLAVWLHRGRYDYPRPFRAWLFGIAANKCRAEYRHDAGSLEAVSEWVDPPVAQEPSPVEAAIGAETVALVSRAVATLQPKQRAVLVLRLWNGMEYAQIAKALDRTEATIRSQMFHALAGMRRYLEPRLRRSGENVHDPT